MIDKQMLEILVCPQDRTPLRPAQQQLLARLNRAIAAGGVRDVGGQTVRELLQAGLVRQDQTLLYPVVDDIPVLLVDKAISLDQVGQESLSET